MCERESVCESVCECVCERERQGRENDNTGITKDDLTPFSKEEERKRV